MEEVCGPGGPGTFDSDSFVDSLNSHGVEKAMSELKSGKIRSYSFFVTTAHDPLLSGKNCTTVSLSANGSLLAVSNLGSVWIFNRNWGVWKKNAKLISGEKDIYSLSLSADGSTLAVGTPMADGGMGHVRIWDRIGSHWEQQEQVLLDNGVSSCHQGTDVGMSADGSLLVVTGYDENTNYLWTYIRRFVFWEAQGEKIQILPVGCLSLSGDTLAMGLQGTVTLWKHVDREWKQIQQIQEKEAHFGHSVSLTCDTLAVSSNEGVHIYILEGQWIFSSKIMQESEDPCAVSLSLDGGTLAVSSKEGVFCYTRIGNSWEQQGGNLAKFKTAPYPKSVSISRYGNSLAVIGEEAIFMFS